MCGCIRELLELESLKDFTVLEVQDKFPKSSVLVGMAGRLDLVGTGDQSAYYMWPLQYGGLRVFELLT